MSKINMIKKSKDYGSQFITMDTTKHDYIGTSSDVDIEDKIKDLLDKGHSIAEYKGSESSLYYASKKTDGFARTVNEDNWDKKMQINVFEKSQTVWEKNITEWYRLMREDPDCVAELRAIAREALELPPLGNNKPFVLKDELANMEHWLKSQTITSTGTSGKRRQSPWEYMCGNGRRGKVPNARLKNAVYWYVVRNTPYDKRGKK